VSSVTKVIEGLVGSPFGNGVGNGSKLPTYILQGKAFTNRLLDGNEAGNDNDANASGNGADSLNGK
jgi:hypothetical protein